jgi:hypothetical protein
MALRHSVFDIDEPVRNQRARGRLDRIRYEDIADDLHRHTPGHTARVRVKGGIAKSLIW